MARLQFSKEPRRNEIDSTLDRADRQIAGEDWNCRGQEKAGRTPGGGVWLFVGEEIEVGCCYRPADSGPMPESRTADYGTQGFFLASSLPKLSFDTTAQFHSSYSVLRG